MNIVLSLREISTRIGNTCYGSSVKRNLNDINLNKSVLEECRNSQGYIDTHTLGIMCS